MSYQILFRTLTILEYVLLNTLLLLTLTTASQTVDKISRANCHFAFDLYKKLAQTAGGRNAVMSPLSVSTSLAMSYLGAKYGSYDELGELLHYTELDQVHISNRQLLEALRDPSNNYTLDMASAVFVSNRYQVSDEYQEEVWRFYDATVFEMDFVKERQNATDTINEWVRSQTQDRIQSIFHSGSLDSTIVMIMVNAVFFKGWWKYDFELQDTRIGQFRLNDNDMQEVEFMKQTGRFYYWSSHGLDSRILELPYVGDEVSMFIILPNTVLGIYGLEEKLDYDMLVQTTSRSDRQAGELTVYLPKVKLDVKVNLKDLLYKLGLKHSFMPSADLSGVGRNLYLTDVVHQATIELTEEGTTGAAALGIQISLAGPTPDSEFRVDHPFMFIIQEKVTNNILFMGRMLRSPVEGAEIGEFNPDLLLDCGGSLYLTSLLLCLCLTLSMLLSDLTVL